MSNFTVQQEAQLIRLLFNIPEPTQEISFLDKASPDQFGRIIVYKNIENQRRA